MLIFNDVLGVRYYNYKIPKACLFIIMQFFNLLSDSIRRAQ